MRVLIACEFSQIVCKAFRERGDEAYSCDIIPCEGGHPEWHIQDDVLKYLDDGWDLMIAHPPCTYLANSGIRWMYINDGYGGRIINTERDVLLRHGALFFRALLEAPIKSICIENPIQHKLARIFIPRYSQIIHPHYFIGSKESKATCLWLKNLPLLERTQWLDKTEIKQSVWREPPSDDRWKNRSRFPVSIAKAMAEQWEVPG